MVEKPPHVLSLLLALVVGCSMETNNGMQSQCDHRYCAGFHKPIYGTKETRHASTTSIHLTLMLKGYGPKASASGGKQKAIKKIVEDKTFGLKNKKKSKTVQKFVKSVEIQAKNMVIDAKKAEMKRAKKEEAKRQEAEMAMLFNTRTEGSKDTTKESDQQIENGMTGKELLEDYEYQSSVQALTRSDIDKPLGEITVDQEIEELRAKVNESEKIPIDKQWFDEWVQKNILKNYTKAEKKAANRIAKKTGKQVGIGTPSDTGTKFWS
ncbi:hypothetical protein GUITHDRAFT_136644 [Guillardia theta CCMP2712]|uniref:Uncharacterized protein n=1 Tax=Guillardia theta (strain CCMP2712) TaxID=905079 RepID=L1JJM8_GUITC|nr:hypothetical protein GUITHDRAFT_136644 [Guillardia theta CCMP2712]EKX48527.1 hypothetical protein GUITHDRAFT_136644 [Guillardia theta CCMP2712]|eukprot:XP_005835507.1 hypothetical protein GUITHDRAFT_136644 [Guillardia theta CCMP2712]